jgi:predicted nucleic acid-binding protein
MIKLLVDTTVWIDFFRNDDSPQVKILERALNDRMDIFTCDIIKMEILQGIVGEKEFLSVQRALDPFICLPVSSAQYMLAADIYRLGRKAGYTIRKSIDCIIAAVAIENTLQLVHNDRDFDAIARFTRLGIYRPGE